MADSQGANGLLPKNITMETKRPQRNGKVTCYLVTGVIFVFWGLATLIWTPFDLLMNERLRMRPGFPPYEWWKNPPDEVLTRVYIFNVTNSEEFLKDPHNTKMNVAEIGPIVYMEKLTHSNVSFNDNSTMTYVATRKLIFLKDKTGDFDFNATLVIPNWALLGMASYLSEESFFVKFGFNLLVRTVKPEPFLKITINQLLWNFTDPILDAAQKMTPNLVPVRNLGILSRIYTEFSNTVTVNVGFENGHSKFFLIDKYDGSPDLPFYGSECIDKVAGATEGVSYPQFITKNFTLKYWRKTLCKNAELHFHTDINKYGVNAFKFILPDWSFNRTSPLENDCYRSKPSLPDGLSDVSKCHFGFPLASSFPHFLNGNSHILNNYVTGLTPNRTLHSSWVIVEPLTGVPMESRARSQSNLVVRKLTGFSSLVTQFSNTVIPMFWLEYNQVGLPWYIASLMYFQINVLPIFQRFFTTFLLVAGAIFIFLFVDFKKKQRLLANKVLVFEHEHFIAKP